CGPWTLSAQVELSNGHVIQTDVGALRDVHDSLAEGIANQVREVAARCPGAQVVVQLDEPSLPAVLAGTLPTASGYGRLAAIEESVVLEQTREFIERLGVPVMMHSCAAAPPIALAREAGAHAFSGDLALMDISDYDAIGAALEEDFALYLGVFGRSVANPSRIDAAAAQIRSLGTNIGLSSETMRTQLGISPSCGLAEFSETDAIVQLRGVKSVAKQLSESG
ncbi:MAG: methionine synthase, partial [Antricoccus sp.]